MNLKAWIEAMRLRTLPVSIAGVLTAVAYAILDGCFMWMPALLCFIFALLAQIASNFANEYYDFKGGLDRVGREGPRRGVTEGDITPRAMKTATYLTLGIACAIGCSLILWGRLVAARCRHSNRIGCRGIQHRSLPIVTSWLGRSGRYVFLRHYPRQPDILYHVFGVVH